MNINFSDKAIERFQESLPALRNVCGWSQDYLGGILGLSRQTMNYIEHRKYKIRKIDYIAFRYVFQKEIEERGDLLLADVINTVVDMDSTSEEKRKTIIDTILRIKRTVHSRKGSAASAKKIREDFNSSELVDKNIEDIRKETGLD